VETSAKNDLSVEKYAHDNEDFAEDLHDKPFGHDQILDFLNGPHLLHPWRW
jgi:hypothetical protein